MPYLIPDWPAASKIRAYVSTRLGGYSLGPYAEFNLALHVGDDEIAVNKNRNLLQQQLNLPNEPIWPQQVHGTDVLHAEQLNLASCADAVFSLQTRQVCAILTADCLPIFLCHPTDYQVAIIHAGWRGLAAGIVENTVAKFTAQEQILAWLGPAISQAAFEVGSEVRDIFMRFSPDAAQAFKPSKRLEHWYADLYLLAKQRLYAQGITAVYGGNYCTYTDNYNFFSYRRDGITGRMASLIWID